MEADYFPRPGQLCEPEAEVRYWLTLPAALQGRNAWI